jgi:hypothetical protein
MDPATIALLISAGVAVTNSLIELARAQNATPEQIQQIAQGVADGVAQRVAAQIAAWKALPAAPAPPKPPQPARLRPG